MNALRSVVRPTLFLVFLLLIAIAADGSSNAVSAQVSGSEKPVAGSTPGGVDEGSSSDSELWRQIRQGELGTVVGGNKSSGLMIQSGGQDWRLVRNGPLPLYSAWAILGTLLLLSLFFAVRGRIKIDHGPSGKTMKRFSAIERAGHWLLASSFIVLALTGLNLIFGKLLLLPFLGKDVFASITAFGKYIHNYVGFAFMLGLAMITVMWIVHNVPNWHDVKWLLRGGGLLGGGHPPARKFNAGQKILFWIVVLCGVSISLSGWALMNPFSTQMFAETFNLSNNLFGTAFSTDVSPIQEQQYQSLWHAIMAVFMIVVILGHIYIGSVGMEGALSAMTTGDVDTNWAREHHSIWVDEEEAKSESQPNAAQVSAAAFAGDTISETAAPTAKEETSSSAKGGKRH
jgi:formate dehydrogenase subunit gamma